MKFWIIKFILVVSAAVCYAAPDTIKTRDGKVYNGVTDVTKEKDGQVKILHAAGVSRIRPENMMPASQEAFGFPVTNPEEAEIIKLNEITTVDGVKYSGIKQVRIKPSNISFIHSNGATSVRFEKLSEDIQLRCKYDPKLAKEYDRQREEYLRAMADAQTNLIASQKKAIANAELRASRRRALNLLRWTTIGSTRYWSQGARMRQLTDSTAMSILTNGGFTPREAQYYLNQQRFR